MEEIEESVFANYYVNHTIGIWPQVADGMPFSVAQFQPTGDIIADLMEDRLNSKNFYASNPGFDCNCPS